MHGHLGAIVNGELHCLLHSKVDVFDACRSFVELRKTSVVWNYKHADVEFGRLQARDLLQHLWTGPISNAPVDIVQVSPTSLCLGIVCCFALHVPA